VENYYENCSSSSPTPPSSKHNICFDRKFHICNYVSQQDEINSKVIFFFVCISGLKGHGTATLDNGPVEEVMQPFNNQKTYRRYKMNVQLKLLTAISFCHSLHKVALS